METLSQSLVLPRADNSPALVSIYLDPCASVWQREYYAERRRVEQVSLSSSQTMA